MKRKLILLATLFFTFVLLSSFRHIPQGANLEILQHGQKAQELIFERKYSEALGYFEMLKAKYPNSLLGSFGLMALYNAMMFENYDFSLQDKFAKASQENAILIEKLLANPKSSAWEDFLCGASSGLRAFYLIRTDRAMQALGESKTAKKCLDQAILKDPKFMDVYLGLGMYDYWRSVFTNQIKILPFFKDRRQEGIEKIKKAVREASLVAQLSQVSLMFVYWQDQKARPGLAIAEEFLQQYPENIIANLHKGRFLTRLRKIRSAIQLFDRVYRKNPNITVALFFKGDALMYQRKYAMAKKEFQKYLKTQPAPAWKAYTHYRLGVIALRQKDRKEAMRQFKEGHRSYGKYRRNLQMIVKLRRDNQ